MLSGSPAWEMRRKQLFPEKELVVNGEKPEPQSICVKQTDAAVGEEEDRSERD